MKDRLAFAWLVLQHPLSAGHAMMFASALMAGLVPSCLVLVVGPEVGSFEERVWTAQAMFWMVLSVVVVGVVLNIAAEVRGELEAIEDALAGREPKVWVRS
jgi:hypothetical protein